MAGKCIHRFLCSFHTTFLSFKVTLKKGNFPFSCNSTGPRQIEQLQVSLTQQQTTSDALEKSLTSRLKEVQGEVSAQKARQRQAVEAAMDAHAKCTAIEASQMLVKQEKVRLENELEEVKVKLEKYKL